MSPFHSMRKGQIWLLLILTSHTQAEAQSQKQQEQLERLRKDMGAVPMETAVPTGTFIQNGHVSVHSKKEIWKSLINFELFTYNERPK